MVAILAMPPNLAIPHEMTFPTLLRFGRPCPVFCTCERREKPVARTQARTAGRTQLRATIGAIPGK
jgi:hypothetical protein